MHAGFDNRVGTSYYRQGNYTMACGEYQRAVANDPWNADYVHNLAAATKRQGDIAGAEANYRKAIQIDPGLQPSYHGLALLLKEEGRTNEAADLLQGWAAQQPYSAEPYIELAWLKRETGDMKGAEEMLLSAAPPRVKPNDYVATAQLGQLYQDTNQPDLAIAMYRRSLHALEPAGSTIAHRPIGRAGPAGGLPWNAEARCTGELRHTRTGCQFAKPPRRATYPTTGLVSVSHARNRRSPAPATWLRGRRCRPGTCHEGPDQFRSAGRTATLGWLLVAALFFRLFGMRRP